MFRSERMGKWTIMEMTKTDSPFQLAMSDDINSGLITISKIREEKSVALLIQDRLKIIEHLSKKEKKQARKILQGELLKEISSELDIKGSIPYDIENLISEIIFKGEDEEE